MNKDFLLVHKSILPAYYETIIKVREEIESTNMSITEACKKYQISRSTYYKYKDYIFYPNKSGQRKAIFAFKVDDVPGVLSSILQIFLRFSANILTISQDLPLHKIAYITITIETKDLNSSLDKVINSLKNLENIRNVEVIGYE
jgi:ACT domain-containing protein